MQIQIRKNESNILRYPRLDTVLMVEQTIQDYDREFKKKALWQHLPRTMMYQTFNLIIDYLLYSRKISVDSEGKIGWIHYPKTIGDNNPHLFWREK